MLRQLVRNSSRTSATATRVQTRSLHSPFAVLSSESSSNTTAVAGPEAPKPTAVATQSNIVERTELDASYSESTNSESTNSRVYVVSYPDPALGAPFGVQLGAYPVDEPFVR
ncbi:hypothetical protein ACEPAG_6812 [Sanghuangporus baumii]